MNTQANAIPESSRESQAIAPGAEIPMMRRILWALKRFFW
jgi:hypothetical protein